jgi:protein tyrosine phosphatase type 4A
MAYDDGTSPPPSVISAWLDLVEATFVKGRQNQAADPAIAVHCVAGLGRAPVLVAIALIEFADLDPVVAVDFIRKNRRGAINNRQVRERGGGGGGNASEGAKRKRHLGDKGK